MLEKEEPTKTFSYPYQSVMAQEFAIHPEKFEVFVSAKFSIQGVIDERKGDFLEIAGPSDLGYYFLEEVSLSKPVTISNIDPQKIRSKDPNYAQYQEYADEVESKIDKIVDGTSIQQADNSFGMVLSSHLTTYPEYNLQGRNEDVALKLATSAPRRAVEQGHISEDILSDSLRLKIASEVYRTLEPSGLYMTDLTQDELKAIQLLGFQLKASVSKFEENEVPYYYVVLQKPVSSSMVQ